MKKITKRSMCPLSSFFDIFGDKWSLLIVRDILFRNKETFGEFQGSGEGIATNILADRLAMLEQQGVLTKSPHPENKTKNIYRLTRKGVDMLPFLLELILWSDKYLEIHDEARALAARIREDRQEVINRLTRRIESS